MTNENKISITLDPDPERGVIGGTYLVKKYTPPPKDDLQAYKQTINEFKERFLHFVDNGYSVTLHKNPDRFIDEQRQIFQSPETSELLREEAGRMLCTSLLARAMRTAEEHLDVRIQAKMNHTNPDKTKLDTLRRQFSLDMNEAAPLPNMVRKGGAPDLDDARIEMLYEPARVFTASLYEDGLEEFYRTRSIKVAQAMDSLKQIGGLTASIMKKYPVHAAGENTVPELLATGKKQEAIIAQVNALFPQMIGAAEERIQTLHSDPDYQKANTLYKAARNKIFNLTGTRMQEIAADAQKPYTSALTGSARKQEMDALQCIQEAVKDVYDIAITHDPHPLAIQLLKVQVDAIAAQKPGRGGQQSR